MGKVALELEWWDVDAARKAQKGVQRQSSDNRLYPDQDTWDRPGLLGPNTGPAVCSSQQDPIKQKIMSLLI